MSRRLEPETSMEDIDAREQQLIDQDAQLLDQREALEGRMRVDINDLQTLNRRQRELGDQLKDVRRARLAKGQATSHQGAEKRSALDARNEPPSRNRLGVGSRLFVRASTRQPSDRASFHGKSEDDGEDSGGRKGLNVRGPLRYDDKDGEASHLPATAGLGGSASDQRQHGAARWAEPPRVIGDTNGLFVSPSSSIHVEDEPSLASRGSGPRHSATLGIVEEDGEAASDEQDLRASDKADQGEESRAASRKCNADAVTGSSSDEAPLSYKMKVRNYKAQRAVAAGVRKMKGKAEATFDGIQTALRRGRGRKTSPAGHAGSPPVPTASSRQPENEGGEDGGEGEERSQEEHITAYDRMQAIEREGKARGMAEI